MWYIVRKYQDQILVTLTVLFIGAVIVSYIVGIRLIASRVETTIRYKIGAQDYTQFNTAQAGKLNFKGLQLPQ